MTQLGLGRRKAPPSATDQLEGRKHKPDYLLVVMAAVLVALGLIVMYSISPAIAVVTSESENYYFVRHIAAIALGVVGMAVIYKFPLGILKKLVVPMAVLSVALSGVIVALDGIAFRWIKIAGFSFQPAELMKFTLLIGLAFFLSSRMREGGVNDFKRTLRPILYALGALAAIVVVIQRDLGSMVVLASIAGLMLFVANIHLKPLLIVFLAGLVLASLAIVSTPYRRDRFETFLNPERDCQNQGYHACQALIAVGSGGMIGLGVGNSVQAYGYLPETPTDSIFAVYAEKFGFIGTMVMVGILGVIMIRLITIASRTTSWEARLVVTGIVAWIGVQSAINIGAMLGLLPLKGITLPFVSYGGSSMIFVLLALGVALRISCYTSHRKNTLADRTDTQHESGSFGQRNRRAYNAPLSSR